MLVYPMQIDLIKTAHGHMILFVLLVPLVSPNNVSSRACCYCVVNIVQFCEQVKMMCGN